MDKKEAIKILVANAACTVPGASCERCPFKTADGSGCKKWNENTVIEALDVILDEDMLD